MSRIGLVSVMLLECLTSAARSTSVSVSAIAAIAVNLIYACSSVLAGIRKTFVDIWKLTVVKDKYSFITQIKIILCDFVRKQGLQFVLMRELYSV